MSWTIKKTGDNEGERNLVQQIEAAGKTGSDIILFCAAEDEGEYGRGTSLPATCGSKAIKRVGSANQEGKASDSVKEDHVDFLFPGENILQELTDGLKEDKRKGSSASTALASGLAALILWCAVVAGRDKRYYRCEGRLLKLFERLQSAPQKFVDVTKILKTQQNLQEPIKTIEDLMDAVDSSINDPWQKNV
ncbi:hypothetical protein F4680DRAFT_138860 [Xylaria scruposa]|nr:hypothetical protein F4680DRAFT_138860 [Xylaria scruposa]